MMNPTTLFSCSVGALRRVVLAIVLMAIPVAAQAQQATHFVGTWTTALTAMQQDGLSSQLGDEGVLVQTIHVSAGGDFARLRLSNLFGESELVITSATLARLGKDDLNATAASAGLTPVTFARQSGLTIPAGGTAMSDPLRFQVLPESDVVITLHLQKVPRLLTGHDASTAPAISFYRPTNTGADEPYLRANRWYFISGLDTAPLNASAQYRPRAVVAFGDSITAGAGVTPSTNLRWSDELSRRLRAHPATADVGVLNVGIGGNRILRPGRGPSALQRFERDVVQQPGVRWVILLIGVNDLGQAHIARTAGEEYPSAADLIAGYEQMIARAHT